MADGWIYRYDFDNGDCYVGKEGSFDPFIRAAEHLQDALAVLNPGKYTGFKTLFRSNKANYVTVNRYSEAKVQNFAWQWALWGKKDNKGVNFTHQTIEKERKDRTGRGVSSVYLTFDKNNQKYIFEEDRKKAETRSIAEFKEDFLVKDVYKGNIEGQYNNLSDPTDDYKDLLEKVKSWKYLSIKEIREKFQVTPAEITWLAKTIKKNGGDVTLREAGIDLIRVLNILFGKETDTITHQRSKTNDWINIFYTEVKKSSEIPGRKAGASLLDVCEMFATLNAYYELGTSKIVNSQGESPEMLNNEIMMASFSSLLAGKQQAVGQAIAKSIDLQQALGKQGGTLLLKNIIAQLGKEGNKAGENVKAIYSVASSQIASIIAVRIKTTNIWENKDNKEEMFKKVFALLTSDPFSSFSKEEYRTSFNNGE